MEFRRAGAFAWVYVDDLIASHDDKATLHQIVTDVINTLFKAGININYKKSHLVPTKKLSFLGATWHGLRVIKDKAVMTKLKEIINYIYSKTLWMSVKLKLIQQLAGNLNYYLAFAGKMYKLVTFFLHNFKNWGAHKEKWNYLI